MNLWYPGGESGEGTESEGVGDGQVHTPTYKTEPARTYCGAQDALLNTL